MPYPHLHSSASWRSICGRRCWEESGDRIWRDMIVTWRATQSSKQWQTMQVHTHKHCHHVMLNWLNSDHTSSPRSTCIHQLHDNSRLLLHRHCSSTHIESTDELFHCKDDGVMRQVTLKKVTMFLSTILEVVQARVPTECIVDEARRLKVTVTFPCLRPLGLDKVPVLCFVLRWSGSNAMLQFVMGPSTFNLRVDVKRKKIRKTKGKNGKIWQHVYTCILLVVVAAVVVVVEPFDGCRLLDINIRTSRVLPRSTSLNNLLMHTVDWLDKLTKLTDYWGLTTYSHLAPRLHNLRSQLSQPYTTFFMFVWQASNVRNLRNHFHERCACSVVKLIMISYP